MTTEATITEVTPFNAAAALKGEVESLLAAAQVLTISSLDDVKRATNDLTIMGQLKKAIEGRQKEYLRPLLDKVKAVRAAFDEVSEPLALADSLTRSKILTWQGEQEYKRLEIEAINLAKEELARREAAVKDGEVTIDTTPLPVPVVPKHAYAEAGSMATAQLTKWEVFDENLIPRDYLMPDMAKIGKVVRAGGVIPGVRSWKENSLRISATKS